MVVKQKPRAGDAGLPENVASADGCGGTSLTDSHQLAKRSGSITAVITGCNNCTALGISAQSNSPILLLCRKLLDAGHDPTTPLEAYRGDMLCLAVVAIGRAANLEIHGTGTHFVRRSERRIGPPIASKLQTRSQGTGRASRQPAQATP
jgi:hypothetical protein